MKKMFHSSLCISAFSFIALSAPLEAQAYQQYETLKEDTRLLMSNAVMADLAPKNSSFSDIISEKLWVEKHIERVKRYHPEEEARIDLLKAIHYEATRAGLDPELVLGLIRVESGFNKYAISSVGARGLMQIMPFWIKVIGAPTHNLFDIRTNLRYGCLILRHYLEIEKGNLFRALGRYNGSLGKAPYPNMVVNAANTFRK